jgi:hypothetical protein
VLTMALAGVFTQDNVVIREEDLMEFMYSEYGTFFSRAIAFFRFFYTTGVNGN